MSRKKKKVPPKKFECSLGADEMFVYGLYYMNFGEEEEGVDNGE